MDMNIESLMDLEVTSVSKKPREESESAAAIFIITNGDLRTLDPVTAPPADVLFHFDNHMHGKSYGAEVAGQWQIRRGRNQHTIYTWMHLSLGLDSDSADTFSESAENASPDHQATVWSSYELAYNLELDAAVRYVDYIEVSGTSIDSYMEPNMRLGWKPRPDLELSLVDQSLLNRHHEEFLPGFITTQPAVVERSFYIKGIWSF
jgi:iron complex outermembrane receptor protein